MSDINDLPPVPDYTALTFEQAQAEHASLNARFLELSALEAPTLAEARELASVVERANAIVSIANEFNVSADFAEMPTLAQVEAPAAQVEGEAEIEGADAIQEAATLALAGSRAFAVRDRLPAPAANDDTASVSRPRKTMRAASTRGEFTANAEIDYAQAGAILLAASRDGNAAVKNHVLTFSSGEAPVVSELNGPAANLRAVLEATGDTVEARTAAASCAPAEPIRDVESCVGRGTPVEDAFQGLRASRGAITFLAPPGLSVAAGSSQVWTDVEQNAVDANDPDTWKNCIEFACPPTVTCSIDAVPTCVTFKNFDLMTTPEYTAAVLDAVLSNQERTTEGYLLRLLDSKSVALNAGNAEYAPLAPLGATVNIWDVLGRLVAAASVSNRMLADAGSGWTVIVEPGFLQAMGLDGLAACDAEHRMLSVTGLFNDLGITRIVETLDWNDTLAGGPFGPTIASWPAPGAPAVSVFARPTSFRVRLFHDSEFRVLTHDDETLSVVPDLATKRQNKATFFGERWLGLCKLGQCNPAFVINFTDVHGSGVRSACATVTPS